MLIDEVEIKVKAGHGGPGKASFYPGLKSGPDGGNGGHGGSIFAKVTSDLLALNQFSHKTLLEAENGRPGDSNRKFGRDGEDLEISFPIGTSLTDKETGDIIELDNLDKRILLARGGIGGRGNFELKSSRVTTPEHAQKGRPGEERSFKVILKLLADFGLIGLPNSGKSSLLNELTEAEAKVADYPFTTLEPNLGVINKRIIADVPGLIEGAAEGRGLGIKFLKHIEKVGMLLHCVASESGDVKNDYKIVREELEKFNPLLTQKKELILLTKTDLVDKKTLKEKISNFRRMKKEVIPISIHDWDLLQSLKAILLASR